MKKLDKNTLEFVVKKLEKIRSEVRPEWDDKGADHYIATGDNILLVELKTEFEKPPQSCSGQ